jgi:outer membrane protein assembly factor BamB
MATAPRHRRRRRARLARSAVAAALLAALGAGLATCATTSGGPTTHAARSGARFAGRASGVALGTGHAARASAASTPSAIEAGVVTWSLSAPLSREVLLAGSGPDLVIAGGLTQGSTASASAPSAQGGESAATGVSGVFLLDTATGGLTHVADLAAPLHDAAGAVLGGRDLVFGGGSTSVTDAIEALPGQVLAGAANATTSGAGAAAVPPQGAPGEVPIAETIGSLPAPRADAIAVSSGRTVYLVGGYNGTSADPQVLATTNGTTFTAVARLAVAVRYPAAAAIGRRIYVFGGELVGGPNAGMPTAVIQVVDPVRHRAWVAGRLPAPLAGAAAFTLGGTVYLAGGTHSDTGTPAGAIFAFDPTTNQVLRAGTLQVPVAFGAASVLDGRAWLVGGENPVGSPVSAVQVLMVNRAFGTAGAPGAGSPFFGGLLLVADRGNDRLLVLNPENQVVWTYPSATTPPPPGGFYFPDDAFFIHHGTAIISNQEENETIVEIAYPSGRLLWQYGHPRQAGSAPGYLHEPDDAYLLRDGLVSVADAQNCRVLIIRPTPPVGGSVVNQIGTTGVCEHRPPTDVGSPNGDTPLADGNLLISEINGSWISEYTPSGELVWTVHLPISYPSDPQQIGPDTYLVADYASPGAIVEFNREGQVLLRYQPTSGSGRLDHPSLAELLPSGVFMVNDDYNDRMVAIDPATGAVVWQYGQTGIAGTAPGMLNKPDGFDLLMPGGATPTHPATG